MLTYAFACLCTTTLLVRGRRNDRWHAVFLMVFSTVQLLEGVLWLDNRNVTAARLLWKVALLNPVAVAIGHDVVRVQQWWRRPSRPTRALIVIYIFIICGCLRGVPRSYRALPGPHGHLVWPDPGPHAIVLLYVTYGYSVLLPLRYMRPRAEGVFFTAAGAVSVLVSAAIAGDSGEFASVWCHVANAYGACAVAAPWWWREPQTNIM